MLGLCAAIVDVALTYKYESNKYVLGGIAFHWFAVGLLMPFIELGSNVWLKGSVVGFLLAVPFMIMEIPKDIKAVIPMVIFSPVMGMALAYFVGVFVAA